ncbi:uridine kinase [Candidatus Woesebacteria bacterium]|nr:uridine kinase [Candidatus Woesebacteria bacterium]MCD8507568.1 uridine kinase [Candidatus Woesebacteria bacterium]MCD8546155.1 uridine kinase [Candidatus Woesebacteria bacterium]
MSVPFFLGIAGGSGSGKTTLAQNILKNIDSESISHISHDAYYRDQSHMPMEERVKTNYDHPSSLETDLLVNHVHQLRSGQAIQQPTYDFSQHTRAEATAVVQPRPIIIIEGILIFAEPELRDALDMKIFVDTDSDIRFARRLLRDVAERGRTFEFGIEQYLTYTKPMHEQFVEPSKRYADLIVPEGGKNSRAIEVILSQLQRIVEQ